MSSAQRDNAIRMALAEAGLSTVIRTMEPLSGGCIHEVLRIQLGDGSSVVAKINSAAMSDLFREEVAGLTALAATNTVFVPKPYCTTTANNIAVLLMEAVQPAGDSSQAWASFGGELAALHNAPAGTRYGFDSDNHLGTTFQPNTWCDDWVEFNAVHRLGHQLRLAHDAHLLNAHESNEIQGVIDRLEHYIPRQPKASLLHGDLWSGNALPACDALGHQRIAVIDPAPYVGDGWADIAMMRLFGGFPPICFERYAERVQDHENRDGRIAVYQLYHVLNHVNLFGRGYVSQAMGLVQTLRSCSFLT